MSKLNPTLKGPTVFDTHTRLAGGFGAYAARQDAVSLLKRVVMANLLWEDIAYIDGKKVANQLIELVPQCQPEVVYEIALAARLEQKLRHTPLLLAVEMCRYPQHAKYVSRLLPQIISRADMLTDFLALYWNRNGGKKAVSHQALKGLAAAFHNFDEYQFAKYDRDTEVKLRDVMFLCHPTPSNLQEEILFRKIAEKNLVVPDTWELALSSGEDKKTAWERLISQKRLGALAFLRNLANMRKAGVDRQVIEKGFDTLSSSMLLPFDFLKAARMNPEFKHLIEPAMLKAAANQPRLSGRTLLIVDVSGSMCSRVSAKSELSRLDCAKAMAILAAEVCDEYEIVCTAGNDSTRIGAHEWIQYPCRGFDMMRQIDETNSRIGRGGIFTRQCLEWCKDKIRAYKPFDRIIVFSDSQDCDFADKRVPRPFARHNYICDISCNTHGIAYQGIWTAEISGFSEHFLSYIAQYEQSKRLPDK